MILFGHPGGNPNSHHAALAHYEAGRLQAFCVPWMPTMWQMALLRRVPGFSTYTSRLGRRSFGPLLDAPRVEGRWSESVRMLRRLAADAQSTEGLSYHANDWLMRTMRRECHRPSVTAVHSYEDCSLWQFEEAKRLGKACIYDLPIGYYPAWEQTQMALVQRYPQWVPRTGLPTARYVRPEQKRQEMDLADVVLTPSSFARRTVHRFTEKSVALTPYGVDVDFWRPPPAPSGPDGPMRFIYAGQCSLRKGIPVLMQAWAASALKDAQLELVGSWQLADEMLQALPANVHVTGPVSAADLRNRYHAADVFVFPSFFEGFGLVLLEAMACGLPSVATEATAGPDVLDDSCGRVIPADDVDALVESLRWFSANRHRLPEMRRQARAKAEACTWEHYRRSVTDAVAAFV